MPSTRENPSPDSRLPPRRGALRESSSERALATAVEQPAPGTEEQGRPDPGDVVAIDEGGGREGGEVGLFAGPAGAQGGVGGDQVVDMKLAMSAAGLFGLVGFLFQVIMAPLTVVMYNAIADLVGGINFTMSNRAK